MLSQVGSRLTEAIASVAHGRELAAIATALGIFIAGFTVGAEVGGGGNSGTAVASPTAEPAGQTEPTGGCTSGNTVSIGMLSPDTDTIGGTEARVAAAELAVADVNDAYSFGGCPVILDHRPANDNNRAQLVDELVGGGADVILSLEGSEDTLEVLRQTQASGTVVFSPNATSTELSAEDSRDRFFRTAPSDEIQGKILAELMITDLKERVIVVHLNDSYGRSLRDEFVANFETGDRRVVGQLAYRDGQQDFVGLVQEVATLDPDGVLIVGYPAESAAILFELGQAGIGPSSGLDLWGVDGNVGLTSELPQSSRDSLIGFRQTVPEIHIDGPNGTDLVDRLQLAGDGLTGSFVAETYDAVVIISLAAVVTDSYNPAGIAGGIVSVTRDGTACGSFAQCVEVAEATFADLDYDGVGGLYEFTDEGEPYQATYRIDTYGANGPIPAERRAFSGTVCDICEANTFDGIEFGSGSAVIDPRYFSELREIAVILQQPEISRVEIQGYADLSGDPEQNQLLSQQRAEAIRDFLVNEAAVPDNKLEAMGYGGTDRFPQNRVVLFEEIS